MRPLTSRDIERLSEHSRQRRNIRPLVGGQAVTMLGDAVAFVTLPLYVLSLTGRGVELGLTAAAETAPLLLFGFVAGVIVDRTPLRVLLVTSDMVRAIAFLALAAAALAGTATVPLVLAVAFAGGTMATFFDSAFQALVVSSVARDELVAVNTRLSFVRTLAFAAGPALGGLLASSSTGFALAFMINAATFALSAVFVLLVKFEAPLRQVNPTSFFSDLATGLRHLGANRHLRWSTVGVTSTNLLFAPLEALLALFVSERVDPPQLFFMSEPLATETTVGLFYAGQALLGAIGVIYAPRIVKRLGLGRSFIAGVAAMGGGFGLVVAMQNPWAVIPAAAGITGVGLVNISVFTMRQQLTSAEMLGRVSSAGRTLAYLFIPVGAAFGGYLSDEIGLTSVYAIGSLGAIGVAVLLAFTTLGRASDPVPLEDH